MRVIEEKMLEAIKNRKNWRSGNTQVVRRGFSSEVWLHGNNIAIIWDDAQPYISLCGWNSKTTISRLNALSYYTNIKIKTCNHSRYGVVSFYDDMIGGIVNHEMLLPDNGWTTYDDIIENRCIA